MKRNTIGIFWILTFFLFASPALSSTFTFDTNNQGWRGVGLYDGGGFDQIPGCFSDDSAGWSSVSGSGALLLGSGGFTMPYSPTGNQYLHWDLNSPDLSADGQWQGVTAFRYDVTGKYMASFNSIYVQAVLHVEKPDGSTSYFTDEVFHEIPLEASGGWATHTVDVTDLGMPAGTVILDVNFRIFFEAGSGHDGFIMVDNVIPISENGGNSVGWSPVTDYRMAMPNLSHLQMVDLTHVSLFQDHGNTCANASKVAATFDTSTGSFVVNVSAIIANAGDVDWFVVELPFMCTLVGVSTTGNTDTVGELIWGCGQKAAGWDDNSGANKNFSMTTIGSGKLFIKVKHANQNGVGAYKLNIAYLPLW